jgi:hypothetical protein
MGERRARGHPFPFGAEQDAAIVGCRIVIKRGEHTTTSTAHNGTRRDEIVKTPTDLRRLLREMGGVQMWQIEEFAHELASHGPRSTTR